MTAKFYGLKSPVPYRWMKYATKQLHYGMNFAYGGTGVFNTLTPEPNMTTQIDIFQNLLKDSVYKRNDLLSSLFVVSLAGNDYSTYTTTGGSEQVIMMTSSQLTCLENFLLRFSRN